VLHLTSCASDLVGFS